MHSLTQTQLLDLWDAGSRLNPWRRAALLLQYAWPEETVAQWPLGRVNARLLELRAAVFGPAWNCAADCPACRQVSEVQLDISALLAAAPDDDVAPSATWYTLDEASAARFRLPVLADLTEARPAEAANAERLFHAIVEVPDRPATATLEDETPLRAAVEQAVLRLDPLSAIDIVMYCPACGHRWRAAAEVIGMLWADLSVAARRLLADVARLAALFGWSEQQILALSPLRRQHYLDMVREW